MFMNFFFRTCQINEQTWLSIGRLALSLATSSSSGTSLEQVERAKASFEQALKNNPHSISATLHLANFHKQRESFMNAIEFYQRLINMDSHNSDAWSSLAYCYLMQDDIQKAFSAYQQALYYAPNSKDPYLWYGLGILYERHGSDDQAEEFFISALRCEHSFEKASEIFYRLGVIFKNKKAFDKSLESFQYILKRAPKPLTEFDIRFQIGLLFEGQNDHISAREVFGSILNECPRHIRTIQYCAWNEFNSGNLETATNRISACVEIDNNDPISWYILGRCHVAQRNFEKAREAYQQAILKNSKSPIFWCSIGLFYFQIQQYKSALEAFGNAVHLNSNLWEIWWNLGILYETCNNQLNDAIDSYKRALEVDTSNQLVYQRLNLLKNHQQQAAQGNVLPLPNIPSPIDLPFTIGVPPPWQLFSKRRMAASASGSFSASATGNGSRMTQHQQQQYSEMRSRASHATSAPAAPAARRPTTGTYAAPQQQPQMHRSSIVNPPVQQQQPRVYSQIPSGSGSYYYEEEHSGMPSKRSSRSGSVSEMGIPVGVPSHPNAKIPQ